MTANTKVSLKYKTTIINSLCRICGKEDKKCIPVFGEAGLKQGIYRKIRTCLPVTVEENDSLPKQICLQCFSKLEASWDLYMLCKEGQLVIEKKLQDLGYKDEGQKPVLITMEDKIRCLSENNSISLGESAIICLAPPSPPPPLVTKVPVTPSTDPLLPAPVTFIQPAPTEVVQSPAAPAKDGVYPEGLIQVNQANKPATYQARRQSVPKPIQTPTPAAPIRRKALGEGQSSNVPQPKKSNRLCTICNKSFPDDIIDHHFSLHLRRSFFTCLDCNKNFLSEEAMSRHRCGDKTINLDPDDEPICL